ncbi:MAG: dTDP-4-dehydrorhamnose 3,5-epimerase family protein [Alphaproteobacteria bacterium]|nr:dTDP-4-dehydrorhamnose 3,5-epimerase family protein [Alphaproteobacteria bacterium]MCB9929314.1 dTDP-4-dehydrorhamnose 3,5-epimerase family protein [Alphaproteobacteria bacterium]
MIVERLPLPGPLLLRPTRHADERGFLAETYRAPGSGPLAGLARVAQENLVFSHRAGTVRGLHAQAPPSAQAKLVGVLAGRIRDVAVDVRRGSPTYGRHLAVDLSAAEGALLFVPQGFLHGYATLTDETLVQYKLDAPYAPGREVAVRFDDPTLAIDWGLAPGACIVSEKDRQAGPFAGFDSPFAWREAA